MAPRFGFIFASFSLVLLFFPLIVYAQDNTSTTKVGGYAAIEVKLELPESSLNTMGAGETQGNEYAGTYAAKNCKEFSLDSVVLINSGDQTLKIPSDSVIDIEVSRNDLENSASYAYSDFLPKYLSKKAAISGSTVSGISSSTVSEGTIVTTKFVCFSSTKKHSTGAYFERTETTGGKTVTNFYQEDGSKVTGVSEQDFSSSNGCFKGVPLKKEVASTKTFVDWAPGEEISVPLGSGTPKTLLHIPWIAENDAKVRVLVKSGAFKYVDKKFLIKVNKNNYNYFMPEEFGLCKGDTVSISTSKAALSRYVFEVTDISPQGVRLTAYTQTYMKSSDGKISVGDKINVGSFYLTSDSSTGSLESISMNFKGTQPAPQNTEEGVGEGSSAPQAAEGPLQARVAFSVKKENENLNALQPGAGEQKNKEEKKAPPSPIQKQEQAGTGILCRKTIVVNCSVVIPFTSPCPKGFETESAQDCGFMLFFYRRASCVKEYAVCGENLACDENDELISKGKCYP